MYVSLERIEHIEISLCLETLEREKYDGDGRLHFLSNFNNEKQLNYKNHFYNEKLTCQCSICGSHVIRKLAEDSQILTLI